MADLTLKTEAVPNLDSTRKVGLAGAIDASTVIKFQAELDKLKNKEGVRYFLLDMEGIRYVNSTGLGSLVKLADGLEKEGGVITLMRIHPKVKVVFDMLGLNAFFKIFDSDAPAFEYLKGISEGKPAEEAAAPVGAEPVAEPEPEPALVRTPREAPTPRREPKPSPRPTAPAPVAEASPVDAPCGLCGLQLTLRAPGDYRCPRCFHVFRRLPDGAIQNTGRRKAIPVQMTLTGKDSCIEGLKRFVEVMAEDRGFKEDGISGLREAITETFRNLLDLAYDKNPEMGFQVLITGAQGEITLRVADHGKAFSTDDNRFAAVKKVASEFSHVPHPNGGNIVRFTVKV